ncbi:unnamed protein product [Citrullus colocynthis]|uniref:Uncharacterized protein n=1 Tax=Citrullus colocynthis TaxID=252529 RepID=A0ABP0Z108_9ROSI
MNHFPSSSSSPPLLLLALNPIILKSFKPETPFHCITCLFPIFQYRNHFLFFDPTPHRRCSNHSRLLLPHFSHSLCSLPFFFCDYRGRTSHRLPNRQLFYIWF